MAEKVLQTRIQLKYDTYENWSKANPVLKKGEMAIATIGKSPTQAVNSITAPQVILKIGDGTTAYNNLPFASALAADVYGWAKSSDVSIETTGTDEYSLIFKTKNSDDTYTTVKTVTLPKFLQAKDLPTVNNGQFTVTGGEGLSGSGKMTANQSDSTTATISHAVPTGATAGSKGSSANRTYIKTVTTDKFGHVTSVTTGTETVVDTNDNQTVKVGNTTFGINDAVDFVAGTHMGIVANTDNKTITINGKDWSKEISDAVAGLSGAMHFVGVSTTNPKGETGATVSGHTTWKAGDVVLYNTKEYVLKVNGNTADNWIELGDESAYDVKGTAQNLINNLDVAIKGGAGKYIASIKQDNGKITATEGTMPTALKNPNALTFGTKSYDGSAAQAILASDLGALTKITTTANGGLKVTNNNNIDIDTNVTFVFDCGTSTTVI